jgi:hypothetical protein
VWHVPRKRMMINSYNIVVGEPERECSFGRQKLKLRDNVASDLRMLRIY